MTDLIKSLKDGAAVPMPLSPQLIGRRAKRGYLYPSGAPKHTVYCLNRIFNAMEKCGSNARPRCEALALALANETGGLSDVGYQDFREGLLNCLDEGRAAARLPEK